MRKVLSRFFNGFAIIALIAAPLIATSTIAAEPAAAAPKPVTLSITSITQIGTDVDPGIFQGPVGDFYAGVSIDGVQQNNFGSRLDYGFEIGVGYIFPFTISLDPPWSFSRTIDDAAGSANISVELWDNDDCGVPFCTDAGIFGNPDDQVDISPTDSETLNFTVNLANGTYSGDVNSPSQCVQGTGGEAVKICFVISTLSTSGDADGDGLMDAWEQNGYDADGDGTVDVNFPTLGANPLHKDLYLELDYEAGNTPTRADITAMKNAFAAAPLTAGSNAGSRTSPGGNAGVSGPANPDGQRGITAHVDMGNLVDSSVREGQVAGTCSDGIDNGGDGLTDGGDGNCTFLDASVEDPGAPNCADGIDNDGDGLADANDPDCLVGDNLGGGNQVPPSGACNMDSNFYATKNANFNHDRDRVFRYALSAGLGAGCTGTGGQGEIGGNDFVEFNHDGGTIMHELGHTLNLHHGGGVDNNCKPNYVSGMNYDNQFGINRVGGGSIIDYSPPRRALDGSTRGAAPIAPLVENALNDGTVLDGTDANNRYVFTDSTGTKVQTALNAGANWNSDTDPPAETGQTVNIDTNATGGGPRACNNTATNSTLAGADDWTFASVPFAQFGDSADGAISPEEQPVPTRQELEQLDVDLNTTNLALSLTGAPNPVAAGTQLTYTFTVTNQGPNPADSVRVTDNLPAGLTFLSGTPGCTAAGSAITCNLGALVAGATRTVTVTTGVAPDLVYNNGGPLTLTNTGTVVNMVGTESNPADNSATTTTQVVAVADLAVTASAPVTPPTQVIIGQSNSVTVRNTVANFGPSSPMNARVAMTASASAGSAITPTSATIAVSALAVGAPRTVDEAFTITCAAPGAHTYTVTNTIAPANAVDTDPNGANNTRTTSFTVDCVVPIAINIQPGSNPNSINIPGATVPLAALTTGAGEYGLPLAFDATKIKPLTVRFGPRAGVFNGTQGTREVHNQGHLENAFERTTTPVENRKDGDIDMMLHFAADGSGLVVGNTEACIKGDYLDAASGNTYRFFGCDALRVVPR